MAERTEVGTLRVGLLLDGHGAMEGPRTTDHGGNDERAAGHHRGYPLFETDYQLLEEIGHGANGSSIVFRAICLPNNEVVAIKCLDPATCHRTLVCFDFALPYLTLPPVCPNLSLASSSSVPSDSANAGDEGLGMVKPLVHVFRG